MELSELQEILKYIKETINENMISLRQSFKDKMDVIESKIEKKINSIKNEVIRDMNDIYVTRKELLHLMNDWYRELQKEERRKRLSDSTIFKNVVTIIQIAGTIFIGIMAYIITRC